MLCWTEVLSPLFLCCADVAELPSDEEGGTLIARKVGEAVQNTLGAVVTAMDIPLGELFSLLLDFFFFCWSRRIFGFTEQNFWLNLVCVTGWHLCHDTCWLRVLELPAPLLLDVSSWFSAHCFAIHTFSFLPVAQICVHQAVSNSCSPDTSPQWPASWSSLKTAQLGSTLSGLVFFQRCWVPFKCSWILLALGTYAGEGWESQAVQVGNNGRVISNVVFNGELSTMKVWCSFMCCVAAYGSKHFAFGSSVVGLDLLLTAQIIIPLLCLQHVLPSPLWVFVAQLNKMQNKSLSRFRQYMHFWMFGLVTVGFFWPQLKLKVGKSKCQSLVESE